MATEETNGRQPIHSDATCDGPIDRGGARGRPELVEGVGPEKRKGARVSSESPLSKLLGLQGASSEPTPTHKNMPSRHICCWLLRSGPTGGNRMHETCIWTAEAGLTNALIEAMNRQAGALDLVDRSLYNAGMDRVQPAVGVRCS